MGHEIHSDYLQEDIIDELFRSFAGAFKCKKCKKELNGMIHMDCAYCTYPLCACCFHQAYWVKVENGMYYPLKISSDCSLCTDVMFDLYDDIYIICSAFCLMNFPTKYTKEAALILPFFLV